MKVEIVFTGLCSFLNPKDTNKLMPEPSVILVQTRDDGGQGGDHGGHHHGNHVHIPYLAFNIDRARVDKPELFQRVSQSPRDLFIRLDGVEVSIPTDPPGKTKVDQSYGAVVRRDDYWPEAKDQYDRDYVPERGKKPKKSAVEAFMRFGTGTISAARICPVEWKFPKIRGGEHKGNFAEEVIYSDFPHENNEVVIRLTDLESGELRQELHFPPLDGQDTLTLHIGNNLVGDMDNAVQRRTPESFEDGDHFKFLNRTAPNGRGPIPKLGPVRPGPGTNTGGGVGGGACGPNTGNS